ncbi:glycosyltransferase family 2 protein [Granulosicoccus sp. 3-233]|uniref:glycosyltransferase family 2 protein n=1 Tax=Granulosicoccus sp. 3-233 TaxID=3417969 RepID=UPI003D329193
MSATIARWLMRLVGRYHEVRQPVAQGNISSATAHCPSVEEASTPSGTATSWDLQQLRLEAGWYMLEIEHSLSSIGCVLTLEGEGGLQEHLLLTSKPVCKRIIRLDRSLQCCTISLDQPGCTLERVVLSGLTSRFAINRIRKRLSHRGCVDAAETADVSVLYADYRSHVHDAIFPRAYTPQGEADTDGSVAATITAERDGVLLLLLSSASGHENPDESIIAAMAHARRLGWEIAWDSTTDPESVDTASLAGKRVFRMPLPHGYRCRRELFHQMLSAVNDDSILVYADHDHVSADGAASDPVLKPAWNPELLLNRNYIRFPWMVCDAWRQRLALPPGEGQQTHDLILLAASVGVCENAHRVEDGALPQHEWFDRLMAVPPLRDHQVTRIPRILASRYLLSNDKYGHDLEDADQWQQCIRLALARAGIKARVEAGVHADISRVLWPLPVASPAVDIIIPTRDKVDILKTCIDSVLEKTRYPNYRILLVDNDSEEPKTLDYYRALSRQSRVDVLHFAGAFNYSAINNHAVAQGESPIVVLLNNDTEVISPGWLDEMVRQAMRPEIGCVGAKLYYSNGRIQHGGVIVGITGVAGHAHRYSPGQAAGYCRRLICSQNLTAVTAACLALRRTVYEQAGGLDQDELGVAWNDVDLCMKVRRLGYRNLWTPHAELYHHEGLSRGADDTRVKTRRVDAERRVMMQRWALEDFSDPAYHPLLARDNEGFALGKKIA